MGKLSHIKGMMDHGIQNARFRQQTSNISPAIAWGEGVEDRFRQFMESPIETLTNAFGMSMGFNVENIDRILAGEEPIYTGDVDKDTPAIKEAMSWIPGPADEIGKLLGTISDIKPPAWNQKKSMMLGHNPTKRELAELFREQDELRVLIDDKSGDYYFWPADDALHQDIGNKLGLRPHETTHGLYTKDEFMSQ